MKRGSRITPADIARNTDRMISSESYYGIYRGFVRDNSDPEKRGRLRVLIPAIHPEDAPKSALPWADACVPTAGPQRSAIKLPKANDVVWVIFEHGDMHYPVWVGSWWGAPNNQSELPAGATEDHYLVQTDGGHVIDLSDENGKVYISITTKGGRKVLLDDTNKKVSITDGQSQEQKVEIDTQGKQINIKTQATGGKINVEALGDVSVKSMTGKVLVEGAAQGVEIGGAAALFACNDLPSCLFSGAPHAIASAVPGPTTLKVP